MEICIIGFQLKIINMNNDNNGPSYSVAADEANLMEWRSPSFFGLSIGDVPKVVSKTVAPVRIKPSVVEGAIGGPVVVVVHVDYF